MKRLTTTVLAMGAGAGVLLGGCGGGYESEGSVEVGDSTASASASDSAWRLTSEPADAMAVGDAKASVSEGDEITLVGRIGGPGEPLSGESPVFTIVDSGLESCAEMPEDNCPTPWDYCCEPRENLTANMATVQLVDAEGNPIDADLMAGGLEPLDEVVVVGTVGPRPSDQVLTVRATGVYRKGS